MSRWRPFGRNEDHPEPFEPSREPQPENPQGAVAWLVNRCTRCKSKDIEITHTYQMQGSILRRHLCHECGWRWKTHEKE